MDVSTRSPFERLFHSHKAPAGASAGASEDSSRDQRLEDLSFVVSQLLLEVEALRATVIAMEARAGFTGSRSAYAIGYRETFLTSHNSAGARPGAFKVMDGFHARDVPDLYGRPLREVVMLGRLGFTDDEIQEYYRQAAHACQLT